MKYIDGLLALCGSICETMLALRWDFGDCLNEIFEKRRRKREKREEKKKEKQNIRRGYHHREKTVREN